jgi:hypothetical protein
MALSPYSYNPYSAPNTNNSGMFTAAGLLGGAPTTNPQSNSLYSNPNGGGSALPNMGGTSNQPFQIPSQTNPTNWSNYLRGNIGNPSFYPGSHTAPGYGGLNPYSPGSPSSSPVQQPPPPDPYGSLNTDITAEEQRQQQLYGQAMTDTSTRYGQQQSALENVLNQYRNNAEQQLTTGPQGEALREKYNSLGLLNSGAFNTGLAQHKVWA